VRSAVSVKVGSLPSLAASLPNGGSGATTKLCKLRFLRIAAIRIRRSIGKDGFLHPLMKDHKQALQGTVC